MGWLWRMVRSPLGLIVRLGLLLALLVLMGLDIQRHLVRRRGIESGLAPTQPPIMSPRMGINVALDHYNSHDELLQTLDGLRDLGYGTLRQRFSWAEFEPSPGQYQWGHWDYILDLVRAEGFQVIAVLDGAPVWTRAPYEADNPFAPPMDPESYARFVEAFAGRYGGHILAYQIWDQPNIAPHWGRGEINPAGYVALLQSASEVIRRVDPDGLVVAGGLAPNTEAGGRNMSDVQFLREIYRRGAEDWFDVLGVKAYGFWSGPYDRRVDPDVLNFSRAILLREEMVWRGDGHKPVWALEGGWAALPVGWQGDPSPLGTDAPAIQVARLRAAQERLKREWPWMTLFCALHLQPDAPVEDPVWGFSLLDPQGQPQPVLSSLQAFPLRDGLYYPGFHVLGVIRDTPDLPDTRGTLDLSHWGSHLALQVDRDQAEGVLEILGTHEQTISLDAQDVGPEKIWLARDQPLSTHLMHAVGEPEQLDAIQAVQVGNQPSTRELWLQGLVGLVAAIWLVVGIVRTARTLDWRRPWHLIDCAWQYVPEPMQMGGLGLLFLLGVAAPHGLLRLIFLAFYGLGVILGPDAALMILVAVIPLAPLSVALGPGRFSITEIALLAAVAGRVGHGVLSGAAWPSYQALSRRWHMVDLLVILLVFWAGAASYLAEYQRVALREWRVVIVEPALLYALLRTGPKDRRAWMRLTDFFFLSAAMVALFALARYPFASGVIRAEGVRRARAFFGSPNNLALYLERLLPLGCVVGLWGSSRRRRWLYGIGAVLIVLTIALTFSRGAWLLGVPAGVLTIAWLQGGRARRVALIGLAILVIALIPLLSTPRLASLTDMTQGTTFLRVRLWEAAWEMAQDHPWRGVGPDNFLYYYGDYIRPGAEADRWLSHPHNIVLDFWLRLGLPGLAIFAALVAFTLAKASRLLRIVHHDRAVLIGLLGGMIALLAHGLIDSAFFVSELSYGFLFITAWIIDYNERFDIQT